MREILPQIESWLAAGERVALATLIAVDGSAPRRPGAAMAVSADGAMTGSVSGGCVEAAVIERALAILGGAAASVERYGLADDSELAVGLPCGSVDVLVETLPSGAAWDALVRALHDREAVVSAVVLEPSSLRARRVVVTAADRPGTGAYRRLGGVDGSIDERVADLAAASLGRDCAEIVELDAPGGPVTLFVHAVAAPERLIIVGATEIAVHLAALATPAGFRVSVVDPRSAFADRRRFDDDVELICRRPEEALGDDAVVAGAYIVTLSHDMKFDVPTVSRALAGAAAYVGALGSRGTHARRSELLRDAGVSDEALARVHAPVGLPIGSVGPYEIALSVLAELIATRSRARQGS